MGFQFAANTKKECEKASTNLQQRGHLQTGHMSLANANPWDSEIQFSNAVFSMCFWLWTTTICHLTFDPIPNFPFVGSEWSTWKTCKLSNSDILFWHLLSFLALSRALPPFLELNIIWIYWVQCSFGCRICLSIASESRTNWSLVRNFQDCLSGREKSPSSPLHVSPMFFYWRKKASRKQGTNRHKRLAVGNQSVLTSPDSKPCWVLPFWGHFFLLCWSCFCWLANFFCIGI